MIQSNLEIVKTKLRQYFTCRRANLSFHNHRMRAQHVNITLVELAKPSTRRPIRAPNGLNLVTLEKLWQLLLILRNDARQRDSRIVTQGKVGFSGRLMHAPLENLVNQLIPFFTILAHQRLDVLNSGSLERLEAIAL